MLVVDFRFLLSLAILAQQSLSIPFGYDDDLSNIDLGSDYSSFLQDGYPSTDSNLLAFAPNDADPGTTSETNLFDYNLFNDEDWLSYLTPGDDNSMGTFTDMTIADSGAMCPLGKREVGQSCVPQQQPQQIEPSNLDISGLSAIFGITNDNGASNNPTVGLGADANAATGSLTQPDPCLLQPPYLVHACCDGPEGTPVGVVYNFIENCALGTLYPCCCCLSTLSVFLPKVVLAEGVVILADPLTHVCLTPISACCNTISKITSMVSHYPLNYACPMSKQIH